MEERVKISKRLLAYLLDILFVYLLISLISSIKYINPTYEKFESSYEKYSEVLEKYYDEEITAEEMNELNKDNLYTVTKYSVSTNIVIVLVIFGYFVLFQKYNNGQTLGKKIMKIKVISVNDKKPTIKDFIFRTLPMYYIYIGSVIPIILNSIFVFLVNSTSYMYINTISIYFFLIIAIITFVMIYVRKDNRGLHDLIAHTKVVYEENKAK